MLAFETLIQTPKAAALATGSDTKEETGGISFEEFLKGISKQALLLTPKGNVVLSAQEKIDKTDVADDPKAMLLALLQNEKSDNSNEGLSPLLKNEKSKKSSKTEDLLALLKNDSIKEFTLNPALTKELSVNEVKYLLHKAKQYLKTKILQADPQLTKKELPKSLKGLLQLADKLKIEITEISFETIIDSKKTSQISFSDPVAPKNSKQIKQTAPNRTIETDNQNDVQIKTTSTKLKQIKINEHGNSMETDNNDIHIKTTSQKLEQIKITEPSNTIETVTNDTHFKMTTTKIKQIKKTELSSTLKTDDQNTHIQTTSTKFEQIKTIPLFQQKSKNIDAKHIMTTAQIIENKTKKKHLKKSETTDLLHSLLKSQTQRKSSREPLFANLQKILKKEPHNLTQTNEQNKKQAPKETNALEELLRGETTHHENKVHMQKTADTLDVKIHEAKQMMKYLSQDIKRAIDEYKPPFSRVKVKLNPQRLGEMDLTVVQRGKNVHINLSSNNAALNVLTNNLHELRTQLNQNGINNATFNFNSDAHNQQQQKEQRQGRKQYEYFVNEEENEEQSRSLEIIVPRYI